MRRFLASCEPEVLALKGEWGVGKTFSWNQLVLNNKDKIGLKSICYVSLFGISSMAELRSAIFAKTKSVNLIGQKVDAKTINEEWLTLGWEAVKHHSQSLFKAKDAPYLKHVSIGLDAVLPHLIRSTVICFDDFERLNASSIKPDELLGFISELKEEKGCKVVLIFNEEMLEGKEIYAKYREKVVDIELVFSPTPFEAFETGLSDDIACKAQLKEYTVRLGIRNIRVLRKISALMNLIHEVTKVLNRKVEEQAAMTLVLLAWCYYEQDGSKPTIQFINDWNQYVWGMTDHDGEEGDPQKKAWRAVLENYGFVMMDEFDKSIFNIIRNGYLEESGIVEAAAKLDERIRADELEKSFTASWQLFHNSFDNNELQLVSSLSESFKKSVQHISPLNLNGTVGILRQLGHQSTAEGLIDHYIDARATEANLFNLDEYAFAGDITDATIRERFARRASEAHQAVPLVDALKQMALRNGWSRGNAQALATATEQDFYTVFKGDHGEALGRMVRAALECAGDQDRAEVSKRARAALIRVGRESPLNAIRVRRYGISPEDLNNVVAEEPLPSAEDQSD